MKSHKTLIVVLLLMFSVAVSFFAFSGKNVTTITNVKADYLGHDVSNYNDECPNLLLSWNIQDLGKSKSEDVLAEIAEIIHDANADVVAIQEVTAGKDFGARAVAKIVDILSRKGKDFDYLVSDPTSSDSFGVERYAYITKKSKVSISRGESGLVSDLVGKVSREPLVMTANFKGVSPVRFFNFHAVPTEKNPIEEIKSIVGSRVIAETSRGILSGDLNLGHMQTHSLFNSVGYNGQIKSKTSLRRTLDKKNNYMSHQYDNIYVKGVTVCSSGVLDFVKERHSPVNNESLRVARKVSDHLPVYIRFK